MTKNGVELKEDGERESVCICERATLIVQVNSLIKK